MDQAPETSGVLTQRAEILGMAGREQESCRVIRDLLLSCVNWISRSSNCSYCSRSSPRELDRQSPGKEPCTLRKKKPSAHSLGYERSLLAYSFLIPPRGAPIELTKQIPPIPLQPVPLSFPPPFYTIGRPPLPPGLRPRRQDHRRHRPLRHRRPGRGPHHRAARQPRRPRHDAARADRRGLQRGVAGAGRRGALVRREAGVFEQRQDGGVQLRLATEGCQLMGLLTDWAAISDEPAVASPEVDDSERVK
ncbi:hypothetical protein VTK73DRAFT_3069 [Phialemonium thermophilum]|uniref:Uncharacterized protein n=1 Tax=Phialemonium thermophilum TaxID=223376 RepID=A0ABR3VLP2_9PEZI